MPFRLLFALLPFLLSAFNAGAGDNGDGGDDGDGDEGGDGTDDQKKQKFEWTPEQQKEIGRIAAREARKAADKARKDRDDELVAEQTQREQEAERKKQEDAGEFDKVKAAIEGERDIAISERDALKTEHEALTAYFTTQYEAALKELPDVIKAFAPAEDAGFAEKSAWLTKATEQAKTIAKNAPKGPSLNLPPTDRTTTTDEDKQAMARMRPRL